MNQAKIPAQDVKRLREISGAGMMHCKRALVETSGDFAAAGDWLRTHGLALAKRKAGRATSEGVVVLTRREDAAAMIEIYAETDFVVRNAAFQRFSRNYAEAVLQKGDEKLPHRHAAELESQREELVARIGENVRIGRALRLQSNGILGSYLHNCIAPDLGRIGVLVSLSRVRAGVARSSEITDFARKLAMHIAATSPLALSPEDLEPEVLEHEKRLLMQEAQQSGKPSKIAEKITQGRLRKYYTEVCLLQQSYIVDPSLSVAQAMRDACGDGWRVAQFQRYALGENPSSAGED